MEGAYAEMTVSKDGKTVDTKIVGIKGRACGKVQAHFDGLGARTFDARVPPGAGLCPTNHHRALNSVMR